MMVLFDDIHRLIFWILSQVGIDVTLRLRNGKKIIPVTVESALIEGDILCIAGGKFSSMRCAVHHAFDGSPATYVKQTQSFYRQL